MASDDLGMFGSPIGEFRSAQQANEEALTKFHLGQVAMQPSLQRGHEAEARLHEAQAGKAEFEMQNEKLLGELWRNAQMGEGGAAADPRSMGDQLGRLARQASAAGMVTKATDLASKAALVRAREASATARNASAAVSKVEMLRKQANLIGQYWGSATDQASWDAANEQYETQTGQQSPYGAVPYSEDLVDHLNQVARSSKERADLAIKSESARALKNFRRERLNQHDTELDIKERRLTLAREREERLAKSGGGRAVASPAKGELDAVTSLIRKDYPKDVLDATELKDAAYTIAAEARALRRANPALDSVAALQQAYQNAQQAGDFADQERLGSSLRGKGKAFVGRGKRPETAAPVPKDQGTLMKNRYYINGAGVVAKWTGSAFQVPDSGGGLSYDNERMNDEDDDNDDGED